MRAEVTFISKDPTPSYWRILLLLSQSNPPLSEPLCSSAPSVWMKYILCRNHYSLRRNENSSWTSCGLRCTVCHLAYTDSSFSNLYKILNVVYKNGKKAQNSVLMTLDNFYQPETDAEQAELLILMDRLYFLSAMPILQKLKNMVEAQD